MKQVVSRKMDVAWGHHIKQNQAGSKRNVPLICSSYTFEDSQTLSACVRKYTGEKEKPMKGK